MDYYHDYPMLMQQPQQQPPPQQYQQYQQSYAPPYQQPSPAIAGFLNWIIDASFDEAAHLLQGQAHGVYVIHRTPEILSTPSTHPGFDPVMVSVAMEGGEVLSNRGFVCRPEEFRSGSILRDTWKAYRGWLTISDNPWSEDPRDLIASGGLIRDAESLARIFPFLRAPYIAPKNVVARNHSPPPPILPQRRGRSISPPRQQQQQQQQQQQGGPSPMRVGMPSPPMRYRPQSPPYVMTRAAAAMNNNNNNNNHRSGFQQQGYQQRRPISQHGRPYNDNQVFYPRQQQQQQQQRSPPRSGYGNNNYMNTMNNNSNYNNYNNYNNYSNNSSINNNSSNVGVGLILTQHPNGNIIIARIERGSPAELNRILQLGDEIIGINGVALNYPKNVQQINQMVHGPQGSHVTIKCRRRNMNNREAIFEVSLVRTAASLV